MQQVSWKVAARILIITAGFTLVSSGLSTLLVFPGNPVSPVLIPLGVAVSAAAASRAHWALLFSASAFFAGLLVLGRVLKNVPALLLHQTDQPDPVPLRFYWGLIYFAPLIIWWLANRRSTPKPENSAAERH